MFSNLTKTEFEIKPVSDFRSHGIFYYLEFPLKFYGEINQNNSVKMYYNSCKGLARLA